MIVDDVDRVMALNGDAEVMRFITGRPSTRAEVEDEVAGALGSRWMAFERRSNLFVGWVGAIATASGDEYDIGWRFVRSAWGRGLATEAASALIDVLFEAGAQRVFAQTMAVNKRSRRVMERCGLRYGTTFHLHFNDPLPGTERGEVEYELGRDDWRSRRDPDA